MNAPADTVAHLSLIIPTLNEAENIDPLLDRLDRLLKGLAWEVIFVDDDSMDATRERIEHRASRNPRIRIIHRVGRRGLSSACLEGMLASQAALIGVMDADLQHDESLLPNMVQGLETGTLDLIVGSRYIEGGSTGEWDTGRHRISRWATRLTQWLTQVHISDPMSGFFMFRRQALLPAIRSSTGLGFKILLDLLLSSPQPIRVRELPYQFRSRQAGKSKLTSRVAWQLILLILDKKLGRFIPARFVSFALVGATGIVVHFLVLTLTHKLLGASFLAGQTIATLVAMTSNFLINNLSTYADKTLSGPDLLRGWLSFVAICGIGALANVGIAEALFTQKVNWALSALAGILVGSVWNYAVTARYTWREK